MLFVILALWAMTIFLIASDPRSAVNRALGGVAFFGGTGALAALLDDRIIPYIEEHYGITTASEALYTLQAASSVSSYYGVPYFFLLFALAYRPIRRLQRYRLWIAAALLVPIMISLIATPPYNEMYPITFRFVVWWAVPYILIGAVLVLTRRSVHALQARTHGVVCLAVLPPVLIFMMLNYVLPSFGMLRMWVYNTWFVGAGFVIFIIGLFTYGFLGIRVLIDRRRLDSTLRAVTSGTAILNHAIKNDIGKAKLFSEKIQSYARQTQQQELLEDIETVLQASRHIEQMISRVHRRTEDLVVKPALVDLGGLIQETVKPYRQLSEELTVTVRTREGWQCHLDPAQVAEALTNLISNSIDAMNGRGELAVELVEAKRELMIEVRDSGGGMPKEAIRKAFEPFYTTKRSSGANFGLGIPYAYHVMRKHGGRLLLRSRSGEGTTATMVFPKRSIRARRDEN
ncbi:ATP-binding protein [Paenibacillus sp. 1P07SE]|uniref:ATP-binding protein n=1 Tax=Paenibacillus sp. 1P07SE TaxID=3132209 RepID=UPI0039A52008